MLEALGVRIALGPEMSPAAWPKSESVSASRRSFIRRTGTPSVVRREIGVPTVFNLLGPLTNPAAATRRADRLRVRRPGRGDGRRFRRSPVQCAGGARRRRTRRADHHHDQHDLAGAGRHGGPAEVRSRRRSASAAPSSTSCRAATHRPMPPRRGRCSAGAQGPVRDAVRAQRGGRDGGPRRAIQRRQMVAGLGVGPAPGRQRDRLRERPNSCSRVGCGSHRSSEFRRHDRPEISVPAASPRRAAATATSPAAAPRARAIRPGTA